MSERVIKKHNFTLQEKNLLIQILKQYKNIIENKNTDCVSTYRKKTAWKEIAELYNNSAIIIKPVSGDQLRRLWANIKTKQREAMTKERQYRFGTGGGSPCPDADINPDVADIVPALLVEIPNATDSDSPTFATCSANTANSEVTINPLSYNQPSTSFNETSASFSPETQPTLQTQSTTFEPLSQIEFTNEKKLRIQILKNEHQNRERRAEEKHLIEVEILKEQLQLAKFTSELAYRQLTRND